MPDAIAKLVSDLHLENTRQAEELSKLRAENEALRTTSNALTSAVDTAEEHRAAAEKDVERLNQQRSGDKSMIEQLMRGIQVNETLQETIAAHRSAIETLTSALNIKNPSASAHEHDGTNKARDAELASLNQLLHESESTVRVLNNKLHVARRELSEERESHKSTAEELEQARRHLSNMARANNAQDEELRTHRRKLSAENDKVNYLLGEFMTMQDERNKSDAKAARRRVKLDKALEAQAELQEQVTGITTQLTLLQQERDRQLNTVESRPQRLPVSKRGSQAAAQKKRLGG